MLRSVVLNQLALLLATITIHATGEVLKPRRQSGAAPAAPSKIIAAQICQPTTIYVTGSPPTAETDDPKPPSNRQDTEDEKTPDPPNGAVTSVTTDYDPEPVTITSIGPGVTRNTAIQTSDDKHPPGKYPFIKGGPGCPHCPPGLDNGGIVLFGMNHPGVFPKPTPPPLPGPKTFPVITVGND